MIAVRCGLEPVLLIMCSWSVSAASRAVSLKLGPSVSRASLAEAISELLLSDIFSNQSRCFTNRFSQMWQKSKLTWSKYLCTEKAVPEPTIYPYLPQHIVLPILLSHE